MFVLYFSVEQYFQGYICSEPTGYFKSCISDFVLASEIFLGKRSIISIDKCLLRAHLDLQVNWT